MSEIHTQRLARLRDTMKQVGLDLCVIGPSSHMVYLTGLSPHGDERPVMLMVSADYAGFLMPALNADSSRQITDLPFHTWTDDNGPDKALDELIGETGIAPDNVDVALDETMRADFALLVLGKLPGARHRFTNDNVGALRARKDKTEYEALKACALINDTAMKAGFAALKTGITEIEIREVIAQSFKDHGATPEFISVCFADNGAFPHHHTGGTKLKPGDAVLIDIGCRSNGYPSDMTRVGHFGEAPEGFAEIHTIVEKAVSAALAAVKPGVTASAIDKAARDAITEAGYGEYFLHRTGHGLGIDIHEPPYMTATSDAVLAEGMVFSIEPGIYLNGRFGLRLEDIVIVRKEGAEILSDLSREAFKVSA